MVRRLAAALLAALVLLAPIGVAGGAHAATGGITGTWKGKVHGDDGAAAPYPAVVKLKKHGSHYRAKINYPGECSGKWTFDGKKGHWFTFTEKLTKNPAGCVSPVDVKVKRKGAKLKVVWREPISGDVGTMVAKRK